MDKRERRTILNVVALLTILAAGCISAIAQAVSVTCTGTTSDTATLNSAISGSAVGSAIHIHGTCLVNGTIVLYPNRSYLGDSRTGTVIEQASGTNLAALLASYSWYSNSGYADDPITIAHMTLNGNSAANSGTSDLVINSFMTTVEDLDVENAAVDGIVFTSLQENGNAIGNVIENSRVSNVFITDSGENGFHVIDPSFAKVTDSDVLDSWIASSGQSAITMQNAAGWKIRGNHVYGVQDNAIFAEHCYGTAIEGNYIEEFGEAGGSTYYGIACTLQGASGSVIANNKVLMLHEEPAAGTFIYIGIPGVNYGVGYATVSGNVILGDNTANDEGLVYSSGSLTMFIMSSNNVSLTGTPITHSSGTTLVSPL